MLCVREVSREALQPRHDFLGRRHAPVQRAGSGSHPVAAGRQVARPTTTMTGRSGAVRQHPRSVRRPSRRMGARWALAPKASLAGHFHRPPRGARRSAIDRSATAHRVGGPGRPQEALLRRRGQKPPDVRERRTGSSGAPGRACGGIHASACFRLQRCEGKGGFSRPSCEATECLDRGNCEEAKMAVGQKHQSDGGSLETPKADACAEAARNVLARHHQHVTCGRHISVAPIEPSEADNRTVDRGEKNIPRHRAEPLQGGGSFRHEGCAEAPGLPVVWRRR